MSAPAYQCFFWGNYFSDTRHLTHEHHGCYMLLIGTYWQTGKPLPDDDEQLARIAACPIDRWTTLRTAVEAFFDVKDGVWRHARVDADLERMRAKSEQASRAGKASGEARRAQAEARAERKREQERKSGGAEAPGDDRSADLLASNARSTSHSHSQSQSNHYGHDHDARGARDDQNGDLDFSYEDDGGGVADARKPKPSRSAPATLAISPNRGKPKVCSLTQVLANAEGFGLPIDRYRAILDKASPASPVGYLLKLARDDLQTACPQLTDAVATAALQGRGEAHRVAMMAMVARGGA